MGRVTNSLVAVTMMIWSPACWCVRSSSSAWGRMAGVITSRMKRSCASAACCAPRAQKASVAKRT